MSHCYTVLAQFYMCYKPNCIKCINLLSVNGNIQKIHVCTQLSKVKCTQVTLLCNLVIWDLSAFGTCTGYLTQYITIGPEICFSFYYVCYFAGHFLFVFHHFLMVLGSISQLAILMSVSTTTLSTIMFMNFSLSVHGAH